MRVRDQTLSLHETAIAVAACARAGRVALVIGSPGVGKTSLMRAVTGLVGKSLGYEPDQYPLEVCILSNREAVDVGGYPVVRSDDSVQLTLFGSLANAAAYPSLLSLDEFLTCSQSVQGPALRLTLERVAGETPLHQDTRIVACANPPDQAPGGIQLTAALVNRLVLVYCVPRVAEVAAYFCGRPEADLAAQIVLPDHDTWVARRAQLMDSVGILFEARPDMIEFEPPEASISDGEPFASPRAWETCCDVLAALPEGQLEAVTDVARALVVGSIGAGRGSAFLSIYRARQHLPTVQDVLDDPLSARTPDPNAHVSVNGQRHRIGDDVMFAAIPLVIEAARVDTWATWVYVARLPVEIQAAVGKSLASTVRTPTGGSKWHEQGRRVLIEISGMLAGGRGKDRL